MYSTGFWQCVFFKNIFLFIPIVIRGIKQIKLMFILFLYNYSFYFINIALFETVLTAGKCLR
jgi:hypothetical protein